MALIYENLDARTRQFMLREMEMDISRGALYISTRLNQQGIEGYASLMKEAIQSHDDAWLASELRRLGYMSATENRKKKNGGYSVVQVPITAPETLAEGEFNRFYVRGLCIRAMDDNITEVEVYRGKQVNKPRPESEAKIGKRISAKTLLEDLRKSLGVEPALGLPPGPNSGLTVRLP
jgi:hypothetical protein